MSDTPSDNRRLAIGLSIGAALVLLLWIGVFLPAAHNRDPLGTGRLLGLLEAPGGLTSQFEPHRDDPVEFILEPFQSLEYQYLMDRGAVVVFSWQATGELYFDLHGEDRSRPDGGATSYLQGSALQQAGSYEAAFNGLHGWFWENRSFETVTLQLYTSGFFVSARELRLGSITERSPGTVLD